MDEIFRFLGTIEPLVYILVGFLAFVFLLRLMSAWHEWRNSIFGIERETAQRKFSGALTILVLLIILGLAEFSLVSFVAPSMPKKVVLPTATISIFTPTKGTPAPTTAVTPTSFLPTLAIKTGQTEGCLPGILEWTFPKNNGQIKGIVTLKGTVNVNNLGFYKYEYSQASSSNWITIAAGNQKRVDADLGGAWNTGQLVPGDYRLRLVVADNQNNALPACVINIRVLSP